MRMLANVPRSHHAVVAAAAAVAVEVGRLHAVLDQVLAGGAGLADVARGRDVVGGDAVAEHRQHAGAGDRLNRSRLAASCRRGTAAPGCRCSSSSHSIQVAFGDLDLVPRVVGGEDVGIAATRTSAAARDLASVWRDFLVRRPDVLEEDVFAVRARAERLVGQVDVGRAGEGIGDDQRRAGEIVGFHERIDAAFEVAVAAR